MKANGTVRMNGKLQVLMNGKVERQIDNLVVDIGKEWVAGMMANVGGWMTHMAVGTSTSVASAGQVALVAEIDRNALQTAGGTPVGATVQYSATWSDGDGEGALTEAGLFDNSSGGNMLARTVFDVINKGSGDVMTIVWTITVA